MTITARPSRRRRRWGPVAAAALVSALAASLTVAATAAPAEARSRPSPTPVSDRVDAPPVEWGPCDPDDYFTLGADIPGFGEAGDSLLPPNRECAEYEVPLDYTGRQGGTVTLDLIRRPADNAAARQGSIFVNPGGPGGSGVEAVAYGAEGLAGPDVLAEFDVVGFDPRGIAGSDPLQCYDDNEQLLEALTSERFQRIWPDTPAEYRAAVRDALDLKRDCKNAGQPLLNHMGTSTVAKDLDVLRRAVGDAQLNFIGLSYGTYVCAQYHAQYPDRVGAMVCDANIDPVEYATGVPRWEGFFVPNLARTGANVGANDTLDEFFRLCDEAAAEDLAGGADVVRCPFGPDSATRYAALYKSLEARPLDLGGPTPFDEQSLIGTSLQPLYGSIGGFISLGGLLAELEAQAGGAVPEPTEPSEPAEPTDEFSILPPVNEAYINAEGFLGVSCSDNLQPSFFAAWASAIKKSEGYFGPLWAAGDFDCASWPGYDRGTVFGPFDNTTANPVLIVNTRYDPATPWEDAVTHQERLPNSGLLTIEGWGHVGLGLSACGDAIIDEYFLTRTFPSESMTCTQDIAPFDPLLFEFPDVPADEAPADEAPADEAPADEAPADGAPIIEDAVDAALTELGEGGDPTDAADAAVEVATEAAAASLEKAGETEAAQRLRARDVLLAQTLAGGRTPATVTGGATP